MTEMKFKEGETVTIVGPDWEGSPVGRGESGQVIRYDPDDGTYLVEPPHSIWNWFPESSLKAVERSGK